MESNQEVFTTREAAEYIRVHPVTMYRFAERGIIPGGKAGSVWRFHRSVLDKFLRGELNSQPRCALKESE